jgi:hypothetical protein
MAKPKKQFDVFKPTHDSWFIQSYLKYIYMMCCQQHLEFALFINVCPNLYSII